MSQSRIDYSEWLHEYYEEVFIGSGEDDEDWEVEWEAFIEKNKQILFIAFMGGMDVEKVIVNINS